MALSFSAGGALASSLAVFSTSARSFSAFGELLLVEGLALLGHLLARGRGLLGHDLLVLLGVVKVAATEAFRLVHSGTRTIRPATRTGRIGNQARRGRARPNRSVTSRSATWRIASAIKARPAEVSRSPSGKGQGRAQALVEPEGAVERHGRLGPVGSGEGSDQGGDDHPQPRADGEGPPGRAGDGHLPEPLDPRTTVARASPPGQAPDRRRQEPLKPQPPPDPPDRPVQIFHGPPPLRRRQSENRDPSI